MTISQACLRFLDENGQNMFFSIEDMVETGNPMREDLEDELELADDLVWTDLGAQTGWRADEVFALFVDSSRKQRHVSMMTLYEGGVPVDLDTDKGMDLDSNDVFVVESEYVSV
jgi:hypothetical protein